MFFNQSKLLIIAAASVQPILATAEGITPTETEAATTMAQAAAQEAFDRLAAQEAEERAAARQTPEALRKLALSKAATIAKAVALGLQCQLSGAGPQTNQERLGLAKLDKLGADKVAKDLMTALEACGINPRSFIPAKGVKAAPEHVQRLRSLQHMIMVAQRLESSSRKAA